MSDSQDNRKQREQDTSLIHISHSTWQNFVTNCRSCVACPLASNRTNVVVWRGSIPAPLMLIGEAPGADEDAQGLPFVGRSGNLVQSILDALEISPKTYHICNICKCRPPENRKPTRDEAQTCKQLHLAEQFKLVRPKVIVLLGATAYEYFTNRKDPITQVRGRWIETGNYYVLPTVHPAYILRNNTKRAILWDDFALVRKKLEELNLIQPATWSEHEN